MRHFGGSPGAGSAAGRWGEVRRGTAKRGASLRSPELLAHHAGASRPPRRAPLLCSRARSAPGLRGAASGAAPKDAPDGEPECARALCLGRDAQRAPPGCPPALRRTERLDERAGYISCGVRPAPRARPPPPLPCGSRATSPLATASCGRCPKPPSSHPHLFSAVG